MEIKLGSIPVQGWGHDLDFMLEVFQADVRHPDSHVGYMVRLQVRREGERLTAVPMFLTPSSARALAALLSLPLQIP